MLTFTRRTVRVAPPREHQDLHLFPKTLRPSQSPALLLLPEASRTAGLRKSQTLSFLRRTQLQAFLTSSALPGIGLCEGSTQAG